MSGKIQQLGFTLLEVLVAIVIFSLIGTALYGALQIGSRSVEASNERSVGLEELRLVSNYLRRSLSLALGIIDSQGESVGTASVRFDGQSDSVHFVADLPGYVGVGGLHDIAMTISQDLTKSEVNDTRRPGAAKILVLSQVPLMHSDPQAFTYQRTLVGDLDSIEFSYYGAENEDSAPQWSPTWSQRDSLPRLVRVAISSGHHGNWPPIVVAMRNQTVQRLPGLDEQGQDVPSDTSASTAPESSKGSSLKKSKGTASPPRAEEPPEQTQTPSQTDLRRMFGGWGDVRSTPDAEERQ